MKVPFYQADAFTDHLFAGNPAAVCILREWPDDSLMQAVAAENNLSETAFVCLEPGNLQRTPLRWFTPAVEIDLCGHATLAAAHVLFKHLDWAGQQIEFSTRSGLLRVERYGEGMRMDFPAIPSTSIRPQEDLCAMLGHIPAATLSGMDLLVILEHEEEVRALQPDIRILLKQPCRGVVFSAPGMQCDFVSRAFYPGPGIFEDPVTGSAHCQLTPYWAERLGKNRLLAQQISARGGKLQCTLSAETSRVYLEGQAITYLQGEIFLPD